MPAIRRILVAIKDPQSPPTALLSKAQTLAEAFGAQLELFHAMSNAIDASAYDFAPNKLQQLERDVRDRCLDELKRIAIPLTEDGLKVSVSAEWDFPAYEAILRRAASVDADLIVVEQHAGGRHIAPHLLRLTDWELLRNSPIPVLLVKSTAPYRKPVILAAIDPLHRYAKPSGLDQEILKFSDTFAGALKGTLHIVNAMRPVQVPLGLTPADQKTTDTLLRDQALEKEATKVALDQELSALKIIKAHRHVVAGGAAEVIETTAKETQTAIVTMGSISRSGLKQFFIGNTAESVLDNLECDVLLIKPRSFPTRIARARRGAKIMAPTMPPIAY